MDRNRLFGYHNEDLKRCSIRKGPEGVAEFSIHTLGQIVADRISDPSATQARDGKAAGSGHFRTRGVLNDLPSCFIRWYWRR